jgi:hypothetical protein
MGRAMVAMNDVLGSLSIIQGMYNFSGTGVISDTISRIPLE